MYKITPFTEDYKYHEAGQPNELRWHILHRTGEDSFVTQAGEMKCRDFFNDLVAAYRKVYFLIYGFDNKTVKLNDEGVYLELSGLNHKQTLLKNLEKVNERVVSDGLPPVSIMDNDEKDRCIVFIPIEYFKNTYFTSLITWSIRASHMKVEIDSWDDLFTKQTDMPFGVGHKDFYRKHGFRIPFKEIKSYPWLYHKDEKENLKISSSVHNCGVYYWKHFGQRHGFTEETYS